MVSDLTTPLSTGRRVRYIDREEGREGGIGNLAVERESKTWSKQQLDRTCTLPYRFGNKLKPRHVHGTAASCLQDGALNLQQDQMLHEQYKNENKWK